MYMRNFLLSQQFDNTRSNFFSVNFMVSKQLSLFLLIDIAACCSLVYRVW